MSAPGDPEVEEGINDAHQVKHKMDEPSKLYYLHDEVDVDAAKVAMSNLEKLGYITDEGEIDYEEAWSSLAIAFARIRKEERQWCASVVCRVCAKGVPVVDGRHFVKDGVEPKGSDGRWTYCGAKTILEGR